MQPMTFVRREFLKGVDDVMHRTAGNYENRQNGSIRIFETQKSAETQAGRRINPAASLKSQRFP
jgi:hypothetical protein